MVASEWHCFRYCSIYLGAYRLPTGVRATCWWRYVPSDALCWLGAIVVCFTSPGFALTPKDVARIVSEDRANQRFIDEIDIGKTFAKLEIPILVGSSVLPALTLVESPVYDEHPAECAPWHPFSGEEFLRLEKLKVGPCREMTDSERSSWSNSVRMVLWPSGHILWMVNQGRLQTLRNRKGALVEYRFARIDFDKVIKPIESRISGKTPPRGYYRKAVLLDDLHGYPVKCHDLVVVGKEYVFKSVSQVAEAHDDSFYEQLKFKFSVDRPWDDVKQFVDICDLVQEVLPPEGRHDTLRSEPDYVWIGKTDLSEEPGARIEADLTE